MTSFVFGNCHVDCINFDGSDCDIDESEALNYVHFVFRKTGFSPIHILVVRYDDDSVDINYEAFRPFERIRRITGYLTGSTNSWNDSKRAEERDRVTHDLDSEDSL